MKFALFKLTPVVAVLLPLLLLTRACDCLPGDGSRTEGGESRCLSTGSCEMPALPRLPRG